MKYKTYLKSGEKYNKLTIIKVDDTSVIGNTKRPSVWRYFCECDCGKIKSIQRNKIIRGDVKSCGCLVTTNSELLEDGTEYGELTIVGVEHSSKLSVHGATKPPHLWRYICTCSCGNSKVATRKALIGGTAIRCSTCSRKIAGDSISKVMHKVNHVEDCGDYIKIFFFNKEHEFTVIDKDDYDLVKEYCWSLTNGYAYANRGRGYGYRSISMHSLLCNRPLKKLVDHWNGDTLDNKRINLRITDKSGNAQNSVTPSDNTSGCKGVTYDSARNRWVARITHRGETFRIGRFTNKEDAIKTRVEKEKEIFGEFSFLNRPKEKEVRNGTL